jgi:4'-phosphopantetheinyl transferase EntD
MPSLQWRDVASQRQAAIMAAVSRLRSAGRAARKRRQVGAKFSARAALPWLPAGVYPRVGGDGEVKE